MKQLFYALQAAFVLTFAVEPLSAQTVWDGTTDTEWLGSGTEEDPYKITTAEELAGLAEKVNAGNSYTGVYFEQNYTQTILLNDTTNYNQWDSIPPKNQWISIGSSTTPFKGYYNGAYRRICGIYGATLFGVIDSSKITQIWLQKSYTKGGSIADSTINSEISSCMVHDAIVHGVDNVGGVIGLNDGSSIRACSTQNVHVKGLYRIGGLIGCNINNCHIERCRTYSGDVIGHTWVGGVIGYQYHAGNIIKCSSYANIIGVDGSNGPATYLGGLVGSINQYANKFTSLIEECDATGNISNSGGLSGGLIGVSYDGTIIRNCYAKGHILSDYRKSSEGGLVGVNWGAIKNCYSIDVLVADNYGNISNSYFNKDKSEYNDLSIGRTTAQMKLMRTYEDWDFENIWGRRDDTNDGYPYLRMGGTEPNDTDPFVAVDSIAFVNLDDTYNEVDTINGIWIAVGERLNFTAKVFPEHANDQRVLWSVKDEWENEVNGFRLDTTYGEYNDYGEYNEYFGDSSHVYVYIDYYSGYNAYLIATSLDGIVSARCPIYVYEPTPVKSVSLNENNITLNVNETFQLKATVLPENAYDKSIYWNSSDYKVAYISWDGLVTAKQAGTATITVTTYDGGYTDTCTVQVLSNVATGVETLLHSVSGEVRKVFENGTIYIIRNGEKYTIDGRRVE